MCIVSNIGTGWQRTFPERWPAVQPQPFTPIPTIVTNIQGVSQAEFDKLRDEVANLRKLLELGKAVDEATGQPDCEMDEKVALIRAVADAVGVDLEDVLG